MKVLCISGKIGSGKDVTASIVTRLLQQRGYSVYQTAYAKPLKHVINYLMNEDIGVYNSGNSKDTERKGLARRLLVSVGEAATREDIDIFARNVLNEAANAVKGKKKTIVLITDLRKRSEWTYTRRNSDCYTIRLKGSFEPCTIPEIANAPIECDLDHLDDFINDELVISDSLAIFQPLRTSYGKRHVERTDVDLEANKRINLRALNNIIDDVIETLY